MTRFLVWLLGVVMISGILHIVTVFGVPHYAVRDPWTVLEPFGPADRFIPLPRVAHGVKTLQGLDPAMAQTVCRFSLDKGPVRIRANPTDAYWSLSLYDRHGLHVWGTDNRVTGQKAIDLVIADDVQVAQLRENPPEELEDVVIVDWKSKQGIALLQIMVPRASMEAEAVSSLGTASCQVAPLG